MSDLTLVLPLKRVHNSNHRGHWSVAQSKRAELRQLAALESRRQGVGARVAPVHLWVEFHFPDRRGRDLDNIEIKGAIDGLVDAGILPDDSRQVIPTVTRHAGEGRSDKGTLRLEISLYDPYHPHEIGERP